MTPQEKEIREKAEEWYYGSSPKELFGAPLHEAIVSMLTDFALSLKEGDKKPFKVITLCGSTKFKDLFFQAQKQLTLDGNIVISVGLFGHSGDIIPDDQEEMLDIMHKVKIDMADEIFVINPDGYIGQSTRGEINHAEKTGKVVNYMFTPAPPKQ